jgi:hypothetical protein
MYLMVYGTLIRWKWKDARLYQKDTQSALPEMKPLMYWVMVGL